MTAQGRLGLYLIAVLLIGIGVFYAFNAFIQLRERGFAETADVPIAIVAILMGGAMIVWSARRS
jgi:hypothetical protein